MATGHSCVMLTQYLEDLQAGTDLFGSSIVFAKTCRVIR